VKLWAACRMAIGTGLVTLSLLQVECSAQDPVFRTSAPVVLVPVTVTDRRGEFVEGLELEDFILLSDGRNKHFLMDSAESVSAALAIVIVIQTNDFSQATNLKVRKVGSLIRPLITGDNGSTAVVGYGDLPVLLTDFTRDPNVLDAAFKKTADSQGGSKACQIDAVAYAVRLLAGRPRGERKVLILIGERKDRGSATKLEEALKVIQRDAVTVFAATWSPYRTAFTTKGNDMPNATSVSGGIPLIPLAIELNRIAKVDSTRALVYATGGEKLGFNTLKGLESALTWLGEELHGQYVLSFPAHDASPGYHQLEVQVKNKPGLTVRARLGFWIGD
jgi:VWFA-related protein